jgi:hypothetical protein
MVVGVKQRKSGGISPLTRPGKHTKKRLKMAVDSGFTREK